jgi:hypothetical protein
MTAIGRPHAIGAEPAPRRAGVLAVVCLALARDAPAAAFAIAHQAGGAGRTLAIATRHAFMSGSRSAMLIGTVLLVVGAVYVAIHGNGAAESRPESDDVLATSAA